MPSCLELQLLGEELQRIEALDNLEAFALRYCPKAVYKPLASFHKEICRTYESSIPKKHEAGAYPRGHGKTTWWSKLGPLWSICGRRKKYIVLLSSSSSIVEGFLAWIIKELETNEKIRQDFGILVGTKKWTNMDILTTTEVRVSARGAGANLRGLFSGDDRPDLIVVDDLEDRENIGTLDQRNKLQDWFDKDVMGLPGAEGADVFVVGTILHHDSFLTRLINRWKGTVHRAILDEGTKEVLAPDLYSFDTLIEIRDGVEGKQGIGSLAFAQEYQNNPIDPSQQRIRLEWIRKHAYQDSELEDTELVVVSALDPSVGKTSTSDYAALITCGRAPDGKMYVLDASLERNTPQGQVDTCILKHGQWSQWRNKADKTLTHYLRLVVEDNGFQAVLKDILDEQARKRGVYIPTKGIRNISDKVARIDSLSPLIESGTLRLRDKGQEELIDQLIQFPKGAYDDGPDALEMCVKQLKRSEGPRARVL